MKNNVFPPSLATFINMRLKAICWVEPRSNDKRFWSNLDYQGFDQKYKSRLKVACTQEFDWFNSIKIKQPIHFKIYKNKNNFNNKLTVSIH